MVQFVLERGLKKQRIPISCFKLEGKNIFVECKKTRPLMEVRSLFGLNSETRDGRTHGPTDGPTDRQTDGRTDGPTAR